MTDRIWANLFVVFALGYSLVGVYALTLMEGQGTAVDIVCVALFALGELGTFCSFLAVDATRRGR